MNDIQFIRTNGLGRRDASRDHISGMVFYSSALPSGFTLTDNIKPILSLQEAEDLGILKTAGEVKATAGNALITAPGATGDLNSLFIAGMLLGSYTVIASDTADLVAAGLRAAINVLSNKHGFVAAGSGANVALTAPNGMGAALNTAAITFTTSGTGAATLTQFSGGVGSLISVMNYHISEFFRIKPDGKLWVGIFPTGTFDGAEIGVMRQASNGEIRQIATYVNGHAFATSQLGYIQSECVTARDEKENLFAIHHANVSALTLSGLADLSALAYSKVQMCIGEDGNWHQNDYVRTQAYLAGAKVKWIHKTYIAIKASTGSEVYDNNYWAEISTNLNDICGYSISTLGNLLGCWAKARVNESPANPERFPLTEGNDLSVAGFGTGDLYDNISVALRSQLNTYHYTFIRSFSGVSGVFYSDSYTSVARSNDYATGENNRTMDKAERNIYISLVPKLVGDVTLNEDGTLTQATINEYHSIVDGTLDLMRIDGEISQKQVSISPTQNVLQTGELQITVQLIPKGKARKIVINNSYVVKLT